MHQVLAVFIVCFPVLLFAQQVELENGERVSVPKKGQLSDYQYILENSRGAVISIPDRGAIAAFCKQEIGHRIVVLYVGGKRLVATNKFPDQNPYPGVDEISYSTLSFIKPRWVKSLTVSNSGRDIFPGAKYGYAEMEIEAKAIRKLPKDIQVKFKPWGE